jgi:hypothetical protein
LINYKKIFLSAFLKALLATIIFVISFIFYNIEVVREKIEDVAFDSVNKFYIFNKEQNVSSPNVFIFAIDDLYMQKNKLFDEDNNTNYGYIFPRDKIAKFIKDLDTLANEELDDNSYPKALFIDYDFSFSSNEYGKKLSRGDRELIEALKAKHKYKILLPMVSKYNFIKNSKDKELQNAIKSGSIEFVSVSLLAIDGVVRRYASVDSFGKKHPTKEYKSVNVKLWELINNTNKSDFAKDDIIANRILFKSYKDVKSSDRNCKIEQSRWNKLRKYSASCNIFEIPYEDYNNSIIMLGGTYTGNGDTFDILNVFNSKEFNGLDIHANTLMTMLHLDGKLKRVPLIYSVIIVFVAFLLIDFIINLLFSIAKVDSYKLTFFVMLIVNSAVLFAISVYILQTYKLWFNWFVPVVLLQLLELIFLFRKKSPKLISRTIKFLKIFRK